MGTSGASRAQVRDDTPANEARYRAQFILDPSALSGAGGTNQADVFLANAPAAFNGLLRLVQAKYLGAGAGTKRVQLIAACYNGGSSKCLGNVETLANQSCPNRIEFDLTVGASGTLKYWISDATGPAPLETATTGTVTITGGNAGWVGVDQV